MWDRHEARRRGRRRRNDDGGGNICISFAAIGY